MLRMCLLLSLFSLASLGCGPIDAPGEAVDVRTNPTALQAEFDRQLGVPRLILLLSAA